MVWERNHDASDARTSMAVEWRTERFIQHLGKGKTWREGASVDLDDQGSVLTPACQGLWETGSGFLGCCGLGRLLSKR